MAIFLTRKRIQQRFWFLLSKLPMPGHVVSPFIIRKTGVQIKDYKHTFLGEDIDWDTVNPEKIIIENGVRITAHTIILTHFIDPKTGSYSSGEVYIKEGVFIGVGTIITKPVVIGKNAIVGAGSVVTKNIPDNEVWAGNPAHFIKVRK